MDNIENKEDMIYEVLRKPEKICIPETEVELIEFFKNYFYEVVTKCNSSDTLLFAKKIDKETVINTDVRYLWSSEVIDDETKSLLKPGVILIDGKDIKQEYIKRFLSSCSV